MSRLPRLSAVLVACLVAALAAGASGANGARGMLKGLLDEPSTLYGNPQQTFPVLRQLRVQALRVNLYWSRVAARRPAQPNDPDDPAYDWRAYDRIVHYARQYGIKMVFSIYGSPRWANGGHDPRHAPLRAVDLDRFANAAALRYSGFWAGRDGRKLPPVRMWLAWNEPNNPIGLWPQFRRVRGKWVIQSAIEYAKICNAIYNGIHATMLRGQKVACGVTGPRGNNQPRSVRPSVTPLVFMRAAKRAGMRRFDAYAHHPYYGQPGESPSTRPRASSAITLGNIDVLQREIARLWGPKRLWITEYGYQTNPPDRTFGVSYRKQAAYLKQAYAIGRANPRIDMMLWFLLRDERKVSGWQSGLMTFAGRRKPAFDAFRLLPR